MHAVFAATVILILVSPDLTDSSYSRKNIIDDLAEQDLEPYSWQIAGHIPPKSEEEVSNFGFLRDRRNGHLLKPKQESRLGNCEVGVYRRIWAEDGRKDDFFRSLRPVIPRFYGVRNVTVNDGVKSYLEMEDTAASMRKPCVMDVKIGGQIWDPEETLEKIQRKRRKYPSFYEQLGFRFSGIQLYQPENGSYLIRNKKWGRNVTEDQISSVFADFFKPAGGRQLDVVSRTLDKLSYIEQWFSNPSGFAFYCSSVLLVYDGAAVSWTNPLRAEVRMIDFNHVYGHQGRDDNYLNGIRNLILYVKELKDELKEQQPSLIHSTVI